MVDVYLFSGFLGSGKTSLLVHTIQNIKKEGLKPAILMNEFGELAFDSDRVSESGQIPLKELLNGCICCSGSEKTEAQLQGLLEDYDDIDVILIETTGAAHPVEALDAVFSPIFADRLRFKGILTVVDVKRWLDREQLSPQIRSLFLEQIRHSHLLIANKTDLVSDDELATITQQLSYVNEHAPLIQTTYARIAWATIEQQLQGEQHLHTNEIQSGKHLPLTSKLVTFKQGITQEQFEQWVRQLPESVYRMKGYVPIKGITNPYLFQYAYGMVSWLPEYIKMEPRLVIIGEGVGEIEIPFE